MAYLRNVPSTPPPPSRLHAPPTPKHGGFHDDWEPFTPRKSARISAKRASIARTPSPSSTPQQTPLKLQQHRSGTTSSTAMASPSSPKKRAVASAASARNSSTTLAAEDSVKAAARLGLKVPANVAGMLPTPSKTPTNRQAKKDQTELEGISRNIFTAKEEDEVLPSPKKRRAKKYNGLSLESFHAEEVDEEIPIYTDSQERLPVIDASANNPFYGVGARAGPTTRSRSQRIMVDIPGEAAPQSLESALLRTDGMVYVFRGKKKFRKFKDVEDSSEGAVYSAGDTSPSRPQTRSVMPRRLLFPSVTTSDIEEEEAPTEIDVEEAPTDIDEEEAPTDLDEEAPTDLDEEAPTKMKDAAENANAAGAELTTPAVMIDHTPIITPKAPRFAPASPPTTGRATRNVNKHLASVAHTRVTAKGSPFDGWRRKKAPSASGQKRHAEPLESDDTKRTRSSL